METVQDFGSNSDNNGEMFDSLLQKFSCLGTQDKDVLIKQFQTLICPNELQPAQCAFFLDMNNWNLQQAICSYFDFDAPRYGSEAMPKVNFIQDITIGEGEEVPPSTRFIKTWRLENPGPDKWPSCFLKFINGHQLGAPDRIIVNQLCSGEMADVSVQMTSPESPGIYQSQWRMCTYNGNYFGEVIWVILQVAEGGVLGLTQQMDSFNHLGSPFKLQTNVAQENVNPFSASYSCQNQFPFGVSNESSFSSPMTRDNVGNNFNQDNSLTASNINHNSSVVLNESGDTNQVKKEPSSPTPTDDMML